jgi:DNA-binding beta-propeller fold protein YncE
MRTLVKSFLCSVAFLLVVAATAGAHAHAHDRARRHSAQLDLAGMSPLARFNRLRAMAPLTASGDFDVPWGLAADGAGNVYVVNSAGSYVDKISATYGITKLSLPRLDAPASIAIDPERQNFFVGNDNSGNGTGDVTEYSFIAGFQQTIWANAGNPMSIATDGFDDLWVVDSSGVGVDDFGGDSLSSNIDPGTGGQPVQSVAAAGSFMFAFYNAHLSVDNGENALHNGAMGFGDPTSAQSPTAATCSITRVCWLFDSATDTLQEWANGGTVRTAKISYYPSGLAYDPVHKRLFASNPDANTVEVYNATKLAPIQTLS